MYTAGSERLRITSAGYVGINQTNPVRPLHITGNDGGSGATSGNSDTTIIVDNAGTNGSMIEFLNDNDGAGHLMFTDTDASNRGRISYHHNGDYFRFDTSGSERVRIDSNGRLTLYNSEGIKLSAKTSSLYAIDASLSFYATNNAVYLNGAGASGWLRLSASGTANNRTAINIYGHSYSTPDVIDFRTNSTERMRIASDGTLTLKNNSGMMIDLQSSAGTGSTWIEFSDTDGTRKGYLGYGSSGSEKVYWVQQKDADMAIYSNGSDRFNIQSNGTKVVRNGHLNINSAYIDFSGSISTPSTAAAIYRPADNTLAFSTANVERFRITSSRILFGNHQNDRGAVFQYEGSEHAGMGIHRNTASHGAPAFVLSASRGTSAGSNTIVQENDYLGLIRFAGTDGTSSLAAGALITGIVDGTPGANDMPTRLGFWTSANGSDSPTVRMTVTHEGQIAIGSQGADQTDVNLLVYGRGDNTDVATFSGGDYTRGLKISTSANGGYNDQNVIYDAQGARGQHIFKTDGTIVGRLEYNQSGFITENSASGDGDTEVGVALQNDYSAWGVIYKNDWIGNNQGWGTFWAGNSGAAYRRVSSDNNPNEHVMVGSGQKRFTFDLDSGGHAYFDGSLNQNNYDYAEYFEWEDGNPSNEDRRGYSVFVNSNGKIEKATDSTNATDIIGVISGTAAVIGDGAIYDWQGKWKVDEWGTLVTEVVKQVSWKDDDEEGKKHSYEEDKVPSGITIPSHASYRQHKRRILNPNYDESKEYIPRDMRQEWDPVGLLGKVRVRDDSPKNPNWKFIKTINGKKLWLIR
jgi:hypothetical protein